MDTAVSTTPHGADASADTGARLVWLDAIKAIGIVAVVFGHVVAKDEARYVYLWHMPFFFFLAGCVFRPDADLGRLARDKALRLLLPCAVFMVLLSGPDGVVAWQSNSVKEWAAFAATRLSGGKSVHGWLAAFWFVTCLYLTQQLVNAGVVRLAPWAMAALMSASLMLAYANVLLLPQAWLPWDAHVCLFAAPVYYLGFRLSQLAPHEQARWGRLALPAAAIGVIAAGAGWIAVPDMKNARYGTPLVGLVVALAIALCLIAFARRWLASGMIAACLAHVGRASMTIMFLHMAVQQTLAAQVHLHDEGARIVLAVLLPTLVHDMLIRHDVTRAVLLGSVRDCRALARPVTSPGIL